MANLFMFVLVVAMQWETPAHKAGRSMSLTLLAYLKDHGADMEALNQEVSSIITSSRRSHHVSPLNAN